MELNQETSLRTPRIDGMIRRLAGESQPAESCPLFCVRSPDAKTSEIQPAIDRVELRFEQGKIEGNIRRDHRSLNGMAERIKK